MSTTEILLLSTAVTLAYVTAIWLLSPPLRNAALPVILSADNSCAPAISAAHPEEPGAQRRASRRTRRNLGRCGEVGQAARYAEELA